MDWMNVMKAASLLVLLFVAGCGDRQPDQPADVDLVPDWAEGAPTGTLAVVDSIGLELGDSNYVFGQIAGAAWSPAGEIAVLDMKRCAILFYDAQGGFLRMLGRQGSGPGEFLMPTALAFRETDGSMIVADAMAGRLHLFDSTGISSGQIEGFFPTVPISIAAIDSAGIVGLKPDFEQNDQGMFTGFTLARWEGSEVEPAVVYHQEMAPFDPSNIAASMSGTMFVFAADPSGRVFRSPMSSEEYLIEGYEPDGTIFMTIEREYEPVPKTEEEMAEEKAFVEERMAASGTPPEMLSWEPEPFKYSIASLLVDSEGNLWVRRGWVQETIFDVFDMSGTLLRTVTVDYPGNTEYWSVISGNDGFLAFDSNPENWSRLYRLELR